MSRNDIEVPSKEVKKQDDTFSLHFFLSPLFLAAIKNHIRRWFVGENLSNQRNFRATFFSLFLWALPKKKKKKSLMKDAARKRRIGNGRQGKDG